MICHKTLKKETLYDTDDLNMNKRRRGSTKILFLLNGSQVSGSSAWEELLKTQPFLKN